MLFCFSKMENLRVFHIWSFSSSFWTFTIQSGAFFYISFYGSSHWKCSANTVVLKNFANFTGKHLCWSLQQKKRLQHRCFPVKFLRAPILKNICEWLLLNLSGILRSSMKRFKRNIQMEKPVFKMAKSITWSNILNDK